MPLGWLACDGASHLRATFPDLSGVLGDTYGGNLTNFNVPDLRGRTIYGDLAGALAPLNSDRSALPTSLATVVGTDDMILSQMPHHAHDIDHTHQVMGWDLNSTFIGCDNDRDRALNINGQNRVSGFRLGKNTDGPDETHSTGIVGFATVGSLVQLVSEPLPDWPSSTSVVPLPPIPPLHPFPDDGDTTDIPPNGRAEVNTGNIGTSASYIPPTLVMNFIIKA